MADYSNSKFIKKEHPVLGGKAVVLRTAQSGDVYQFRMWIAEEKKYVRESLRTRDLETAINRAEEKVFQIYSDVKSGRKLFGITLNELVQDYLKYRHEDIETNTITEGRYRTIKYQMNHLLAYKGTDTKVSELDRNSCYEYANWCRTHRKGVQDITIRNEQTIFNHMMKYAYRNGLSHFMSFEFRNMIIRKDENCRRGTFSLEEYDALAQVMRTWSSRKVCGDNEQLRNERLMIRDCILIASNTMLRVGELWQLKWGDIQKFEELTDELGKNFVLVTIDVRAEISKRRTSRTISTRGGEYLKRLKERSIFTSDNDYVFCGECGADRFSKKKLYSSWKELMELINVDYKKHNITWYSLRHFGITCRLRAGALPIEVAKLAGTSITFIDTHYSHYDEEMAKAVAVKNFTFNRHGIAEKSTHSN